MKDVFGERPSMGRRRFLQLTTVSGVGLTCGAVLSGAGPAQAAPATTAPRIYSTAEWAAVPPSSSYEMFGYRPTKLLIHHTATANSTDYSVEHGFALARSIQRFHMESRGWSDTGQHFTLTRGGHALEGRHNSLAVLRAGTGHVQGAHCTAQNNVAVGIENEGDYTSVEPRAEHYAALVELSAYICGQFGIRPYQVYGHRDFSSTTCPGQLYALLPQLRADIAARIGGDPTSPAWPVTRRGDRGQRVRALQYLLRSRGATITVDGDFGPATETAVRAFQEQVRASVDGSVGPQTWNQLAEQLARGAVGEAVKATQNQLLAQGIDIGAVDGSFGPATEAGVATFQRRVGLVADGVVDPRTLSRLLA